MKIVNRFMSSLVLVVVFASLTGCGGGEDGGGGPAGAMVSLGWDPVQHPTQISYTVYYGKQSVGGGSCNYENSFDVNDAFATVTGLDPDTTYYFSVSANNEHGHRSHCSEEVSTVTPSLQI